MKYSIKKDLVSGVAIPVSALKSEDSIGVGEFLDLKLFADWCQKVNLDLIQLLPVNDTGFQSSPYSALSAFALHPIYIRISALPKSENYANELEQIKQYHESKEKVDFIYVLKDKLELLNKIYIDNYKSIEKSKDIELWVKNNDWVKTYSIFSWLKFNHEQQSWLEWPDHRESRHLDIEALYNENIKETLFYTWLQYNLELQLKEAVDYLSNKGINLKGDLPILMNLDSADVWAHRNLFNIESRAGAPPDMYSEDGQNWGFPTYFWDNMEEDDYSWWKARLKQAAKFYHAYRIDHVLGFFRIWTIPPKYISGSMGYYNPSNHLSLQELANIGIYGERLKWLSEPHVPGHELRNRLGLESNEIIKQLLQQINNEDLYLFKDDVKSVYDIYNNDEISDEAKNILVELYQNILLLKISDEKYATTWYYYKSRAYHSMNDHERYEFEELLKSKYGHSTYLWETQGLKLLKFMKESEDMLVCAEDLGIIPDCVPKVLEELGILGLHVVRWSRKYKQVGEPYMKPSEYNYLSVATPAVHDSTTVRQWWNELCHDDELSNALNIDPKLGYEASPSEVTRLYNALIKTSSQVAMFQFQDLLAISEGLRRDNPDSERINTPGTVNDDNWCYRMDFKLENLLEEDEFNKNLKGIMEKRGI